VSLSKRSREGSYPGSSRGGAKPTSMSTVKPPSEVLMLEAEAEALTTRIATLEKKWSEIDELKNTGCTVDATVLNRLTDELIRLKLKYAQNQENIDKAKSQEKGLVNAVTDRSRDSNCSSVSPDHGSPERSGEAEEEVTESGPEVQRISTRAKQGRGKMYVEDITEKYLNDRVYVEDDSFTSTDDVESSDEEDPIAAKLPGGVLPVIHTAQARQAANRTKNLSYRGIYGVDNRSRAGSVNLSRSLSGRTLSVRSSMPGASFMNAREVGHAGSVPGGVKGERKTDRGDETPSVQIFEAEASSDLKQKIFLMSKLDSIVIREPSMGTIEYGSSNWGYDLVAFMQNPIRREVFDMYYIYNSMAKRVYFLESEEFELLFDWFEVFRLGVAEFFSLEEEVIYPRLDSADAGGNPGFDTAHGPKMRKERKKKIREVVDRIWNFGDTAKLNGPGPSIKTLGNLMDDLSLHLLTYFNEQIAFVPKVVQRRMMPKDVRTLEEKYIQALKKRRYPHDLFQLLMHWSRRDSREFRARMRKIYLEKGNSISKSLWVKQYKSGRGNFKKGHLGVVRTFYERWNQFERERISAMEQAEVSRYQNPFMRGTI